MSTAPNLLPQAFWFRPALACPRLDGIPGAKAALLDLPVLATLADFEGLEGRESWSEVRAAWNAGGIGFEFRVKGKKGPIVHAPSQPTSFSDGVELWLDTRDTRDVHCATRFCHHFLFGLVPDKKTGLKATVDARNIARAARQRAQGACQGSPDCAERIESNDWRLEVWFPAEALNGYDPETNRRLGVYYQVNDSERRRDS